MEGARPGRCACTVLNTPPPPRSSSIGVCRWPTLRCSTISSQRALLGSCTALHVSGESSDGERKPPAHPAINAAVLTLCAGTPPLQQLLQLWDYLLSFGAHLSILCIVAQLLLIRDELIASPHPMKLLRQFPDLNAKSIIGVATTLVRDLDDALYDDLVSHMVEL